ncbi:MAG: PA14 domain-containing protein [Caldilineaceae bacterium]
MLRWKTLLTGLLVLAVLLTTVSSVFAQDVQTRHTDPGWQALYWNNTSLSGSPVLQRYDRDLNFDWGYGAPDGSLPADQFSARWLRYIDVKPATYRFTALSDDGIRLWVDGALLIDFWWDHPAQSRSADLYLGPGHHLVQVEYYENGGAAVAKVDYQLADQPAPPTPTPTPSPVPPPTDGWTAEYFNNITLDGPPMITQIDANIDFNWGTNSPNFRFLPADYFSVRWTRNMNLPAGNYHFTMSVDDGARLFVNGHTLIDAWREQPARDYTGDIYLPGGPVTVQMEYFELTGAAVARLRWQTNQPGGGDDNNHNAVIVDDSDPGFTRGGLPRGWAMAYEGYNNNLTWTQNNDWARPQYNWGRWYPRLRPGRYEVFVYIPDRYSTTSSALYWISHAGGFTKRMISQNDYSNQWVSLGTYNFSGTSNDYLSLSDVTGERYLSRLLVWDAAKWEPR